MKNELEKWLYELFTDSNKPLHFKGNYNYSNLRQFINRLTEYTEGQFMDLVLAQPQQQYVVYQKKEGDL